MTINTHDQILLTTCALLEKQGYHGTGLSEIVRESGAPKGSLYYYFPSGKEQITTEAIAQAGAMTAERIRAGLAEVADPAQAVHDFILKIADGVEASGFAAGSPLTAVAMETALGSERINEACRNAYALLIAAFREHLITNGMDAARAIEFATFITASIEGGIILSRANHDGTPLRMVARQLFNHLSGQE